MASSKNKLTGFLKWIASGWMLILFFVLFFLFWEYSIPLFDVPRYILPAPSEIVQKGSADIDKLIYYTGVTGLETIIGYAIAIILGLGFGIAISFSSILRRTLYPFFVSIEMTPKIAFAPLFISWFGFGLLPKVIIVVLVCFFLLPWKNYRLEEDLCLQIYFGLICLMVALNGPNKLLHHNLLMLFQYL